MRRRSHHLAAEVFTKGPVAASLTMCTASRSPAFQDERCAAGAVHVIGRIHGPNSRMLAFCVMPDHVHVIVLNQKHPLQSVVRLIKRETTQALSRLGVPRPLWQRGYYDHAIRRNEGLFKTIRYVLMNPVRAGLAEYWREYPWAGSFEWPELDDAFLDDRIAENVVMSELLGTD
jgi:REP element-mobilizing transposase RayT